MISKTLKACKYRRGSTLRSNSMIWSKAIKVMALCLQGCTVNKDEDTLIFIRTKF